MDVFLKHWRLFVYDMTIVFSKEIEQFSRSDSVLEIMFMCSCTHILYIEAAETENTVSDTHARK